MMNELYLVICGLSLISVKLFLNLRSFCLIHYRLSWQSIEPELRFPMNISVTGGICSDISFKYDGQ